MKLFKTLALLVCCLIVLPLGAQVPDALYFRFNEGAGTTAANSAMPGVGNNPATIVGSLNFGAGQLGGGIVGTGLASSANYVDTGWVTNLTGTSFTIEFWVNPSVVDSTLRYLCGDVGGATLRIFSGGVAGTGNLWLRGTATTITDAPINGCVATIGQWNHVAWVCDRPNNVIHAYLNGAPVGSVAQPANPSITGTGPFKVCAQSTSTGLTGSMDEFRLWLQARSAADIAANYASEVNSYAVLTAATSGGGIGDLTFGLSIQSPLVTEGYLLVTDQATQPVGSGPLIGIYPSALTWPIFSVPASYGNPFHFLSAWPPSGVAFPDTALNVPPGTLSFLAGQTWDVGYALLSAGVYLEHTAIVRLAW
jgi:hypothetical protein